MKLVVKSKHDARLRRARKLRAANIKQANTSIKQSKPVVIVHRTNQHMYAQLVSFEDHKCIVLAQANTAEKDLSDVKGSKSEQASAVGKLLGKRVKEKGFEGKVIFDRNGFKYHGRVKALADGLRETGVEF